MMNTTNIFQNIPRDLAKEITEVIAENERVRIERIISRGHNSPRQFWYDQPQDEFILLLTGEAVLLFKDQLSKIRLSSGDYLIIPAHTLHRVDWTSAAENTIWLAVFLG